MGAEPAVRISCPEHWSEIVGAVLVDHLGPFQETGEDGMSHLLFFPFAHDFGYVSDAEIFSHLPESRELEESLVLERVLVPGGWEDSWKEHFQPFSVGRLRVRPPWDGTPAALASRGGVCHDLVLSPGLAFGTGLHPTTRSLLSLLQEVPAGGPLVDAGTGSGILALAASRLGFAPVRAFDNDPLAVDAARSNASANGVELDVVHAAVDSAPSHWFREATVTANITLQPILSLFHQFRDGLEAGNSKGYPPPRRVLVAGTMRGEQEAKIRGATRPAGFEPRIEREDGEWASFVFERIGGG